MLNFRSLAISTIPLAVCQVPTSPPAAPSPTGQVIYSVETRGYRFEGAWEVSCHGSLTVLQPASGALHRVLLDPAGEHVPLVAVDVPLHGEVVYGGDLLFIDFDGQSNWDVTQGTLSSVSNASPSSCDGIYNTVVSVTFPGGGTAGCWNQTQFDKATGGWSKNCGPGQEECTAIMTLESGSSTTIEFDCGSGSLQGHGGTVSVEGSDACG